MIFAEIKLHTASTGAQGNRANRGGCACSHRGLGSLGEQPPAGGDSWRRRDHHCHGGPRCLIAMWDLATNLSGMTGPQIGTDAYYLVVAALLIPASMALLSGRAWPRAVLATAHLL